MKNQKVPEINQGSAVADIDIAKMARTILAAETGPRIASVGPFRCRKPVHPGGRGVIVLNVAANNDGGPVTIELSPSDLHSRSGCSIAADLIRLEPSQVTIPPGSSETLKVHVKIPQSADPGIYSGRVSGYCPEPVSFVVEYEVVQEQ
ncbi:MAG: hypothetical protein ACR2O1_00650 [Boseongicola sp.]